MGDMYANLSSGTAPDNQAVVDLVVVSGSAGGGTTVDSITDAGAFGKTMLKADSNGTAQLDLGITAFATTVLAGADAAAIRTTLGAGTSSVALAGTGTAATGSHSDHTHTVSQVTDLTAAKLMTGSLAAVNNSVTFTDLTAATTAFNALLAALRLRGIISGS